MTDQNPRLDGLAEYLVEINRYPLLSAEEEVRLARQMAEGASAARRLARAHATASEGTALEECVNAGRSARQQLVESNLRLVVSIARRYRGHGLVLQDLIQEGNIGLQTGVEKYDWRKGYRLTTYVYWWIRQAMTRALSNDSRTIRLPVHAGEMLRTAGKAEQRLEAELGRAPTLGEVAERIHVQSDRLQALRVAAAPPASLDEPLAEDSSLTRADIVVDESSLEPFELTAETTNLRQNLTSVLEQLPERERAVLKLHFGLEKGNPSTLAEVGKRMGFTRERARQIEGQAMRRLRADTHLRRALVELTTN